jgi:hypothetical protein
MRFGLNIVSIEALGFGQIVSGDEILFPELKKIEPNIPGEM